MELAIDHEDGGGTAEGTAGELGHAIVDAIEADGGLVFSNIARVSEAETGCVDVAAVGEEGAGEDVRRVEAADVGVGDAAVDDFVPCIGTVVGIGPDPAG